MFFDFSGLLKTFIFVRVCYNSWSSCTAEICKLKCNQNTSVGKCICFYMRLVCKFKRSKSNKKPNVLVIFHVWSGYDVWKTYLFSRNYFSVFYVFIFLEILCLSHFY
jgi:hypothetical protein